MHHLVTSFSPSTSAGLTQRRKQSYEKRPGLQLAASNNEQDISSSLPLCSRRSFGSAIAVVLAFGRSSAVTANNMAQFNTVKDIPEEYFSSQSSIYGFVERVIDGDTMRVRHVPGYGISTSSAPPQPINGPLANVTLSIRLYGVDTPETGKNKRQVSMPFGDEAKQFTNNLVYHKMVKVTLLRRDKYGRAVACVEVMPDGLAWPSLRDLSLALAEAGLAEMYTGAGAVYYNKRDDLEQAIVVAQRDHRGIWSLENRQTIADYKRQQNGQQVPSTALSY